MNTQTSCLPGGTFTLSHEEPPISPSDDLLGHHDVENVGKLCFVILFSLPLPDTLSLTYVLQGTFCGAPGSQSHEGPDNSVLFRGSHWCHIGPAVGYKAFLQAILEMLCRSEGPA